MLLKSILIYLGKLVLCGFSFILGTTIGGIIATLLGLSAAQNPEIVDMSLALRYLILESPLLALALALVASGIRGGILVRSFVLFLLAWIAYTVNTQLDAILYTEFGGGFWFSLVSFGIACLFSGVSAAWLFPSHKKDNGLLAEWKDFFRQRSTGEWIWRLGFSAIAFMPIYYFMGLLVVPFTRHYYQENAFGLRMPELNQILVVLFIRSLLFLLACLPVIVLWCKGRVRLFLSLGFSLFVLVGLLYMLAAYWMPLSVRLPHMLEILVDEFLYAGVLVALFKKSERKPDLVLATQTDNYLIR